MRIRRWIAGCLTVLTVCLPFAGAADAKTKARQEDIEYLMEILDTKHPDFYTKATREEVREKKAEIESKMDTLSDFDFAVELAELTAMGGDSHTMLAVSNALPDAPHMIPAVPEWFDGKWVLTGALKEFKAYLGQEVVSVGGKTMDELLPLFEPMISCDNETYLRRQFGQMLYTAELLAHYGVIREDAESVPVGVRDDAGGETVLDVPVLSREEYFSLAEGAFATADQLRTAVPATEPSGAYYKLLDLGGGALYMQYNRCVEAPDLPMADFAAIVQEKLSSGAYTKFLIDLRNNGGGSDGVLYPVVYQAQQFLAKGGAVYALAGERTFSSALINTVQLKDVGAAVVGAPTGGSVDHFGSVTGFELPNSRLRGQYSNKFIELSGFYEAARPYGIESFRPDQLTEQSFADYLAGVDTVVQRIMENPPAHAPLTAQATVSSARVTVNGKPVAAAAYNIDGSNYFKLRDLAAAFAETGSPFNVLWDENARKITLTDGAYEPVGGELAPLSGGAQTAKRATVDTFADDMPLVGKAYEIAGNHYFKLRDLCRMIGAGVEWDAATKTINLTTK